ncbi:MAG: hypothetical protein ACRDZ8_05945 [Acidimicrobiales bacterium]
MTGAIFLLIVAVLFAVYVSGLIGTIRYPAYAYEEVGRSKAVTVVMVALTGFIGATYFLLRIRPGLSVGSQVGPPPRRGDVDTGDIKEWRRTRDPWT